MDLNGSFPPLVGTFKKTEAEVAAAYIVRTLQMDGDSWHAVVSTDIAAQLRADLEAQIEPWASLAQNPFARPDVHRLVADGFAEWTEEGDSSPIRFTEKGIEALRRWVRPKEAAVQS